MKIKKSPSKKLAPLPRQLSDLIRRLEVEEKEHIPSIIRELSSWPYARGDLFHWVAALDRLDAILLDICTEYNLKDIQTKPFDDQTKELILSIIDLARILFENCTNRNIYNSYEHLNMLLNTFDMDVLEQVLHFLIRPAQRINNPKAIRSSFVIPQDKIVELARGWSHVPVELLRIAQDLTVTPKMTTLNLQFYRTTTTEGHQVITENMADQTFQHKEDVDVFMDLVQKYNVPKESQFELANRIRIAKHVSDPEKRQQLLGIRILAITVMSHAISETTAQNKVFIYEPYLISQLAELISPEKQADTTIQTYVLYALDGIARHRNKLSEVLIAVNASANHGTMMQILRKANLNEAYPQSFLDALFTFVSFLLQTQPGGQMLMSAGIIPTLVQIVGNYQYTQLKNVAKVVGLIDTIVNSFATSFSAFCNANGLDTLLNRIKMEIETCTKSAMPNETQLNATNTAPYDRLSTIKAMLKFLLRMMGSSGTTDGLRNLIDSSLPQSLKLIMENPKLFGNGIFALAINVSTTFIHNEPTSLPILQEAKLPQSFLHTISTYDSPNHEVLMAAVNAFGAMCLNVQGLDMFNTEKPLPHFFDLMTSHDFLRNPMDVDSATGLGSTMDELIRHHPSLKPSVFQCVTSLIKKVIEMGSDVNGVGKSSDNSHLLQTSSEDAAMSTATTSAATTTKTTTTATKEQGEEEDKPEKVECLLVSFIDLVSRFLEGLFQNQSNIKEFVQEGCPEMLLNYYALPLLPANFSVTIASDSLSYLFRMISEVSPLPTVLAIAAKVKESIRFITDQTGDYQTSTLMEFVDVNATETDKVARGNQHLRQMIQLHGYVGLLSNLCCSALLSHGRNGASLVTEFLSESKQENIIQLLGQLHRHIVWENILLKEALPPAWYAVKSSSFANGLGALKMNPASLAEHPLGIYSTNTPTEASATTSASTAAGAEEVASSSAKQDEASKDKMDENAPSAKDPRMVNIKHFKILLGEIPQLLVPVFQALIKVSLSRRTGSALPKSQTMKLAEYMSDILKDNITWPPITQATAPDCKYDYLTSVYTMTSLLLRDERTQSSLQAPLAIAFEKQGGIDLLLGNLKDMWTAAQALYLEQDKEKHKELTTRVNSSIESLLNVLLHISSPKSLRDSAYTTTLIQKDKKAEDYFDPYEWIVCLELKLIPLKDYLTCPQLHLFSKAVNQILIKIFQQIMKGEGSFASLSSTATSTTRGAGATVGDPFGNFTAPLMTSPFTLLRTPVVAAERNIQTLVDMGFERASAEQALVRCNNQVSRAVDYLFSHPTPIFGGSTTATTTATTTPPAPPATETSSEAAPTNSNTQEDAQINQEASSDDDNNDDDEENNEDHNDNEDEHEDDGDDDDNSLHDSDNMEGVIDTFVESLNNDYRLDAATSGLRRSLFNSMGGGGSSSNEASGTPDKEPSEHVKELKAVRQSLCELLPAALLALADQREDLVFDVRDLLILLGKYDEEEQSPENKRIDTTKTSLNIISLLVDQIGEIRDDSSKSVLLSNRLRLLALLLREPPMQNAMNQLADRFSFLFDMLNFSSLGQDDPLPAWSATIFLVIEAFIAQADEPKKAKLNINSRRGGMFFSSSASSDDDDNEQENALKQDADKSKEADDDEDVAMEDVNAPSTSSSSSSTSKAVGISVEQRSKLLQCCVSLLRKSKLSRDDIYAILRMIVRLTKDHESALHFLGIGGVPLLFSKPRSSLEGLQGQQAFIILILRHIVESKAVLQSTMKDIITNWFTNPRPRNMDISSFVRSNAHVALREPEVFVQVTTDICRLARYDEFEINHQIKLKKQEDDKQDADSGTTAITKQASSSEVVVYYLLNEIMTVRTEATAVASRKEPLTDEQKKEENIKFVYTGFLLQCLVELISSYPSCKYDIFNFCKKQNGQRTTTLDGKHRSFVSMLINDLLPYNHINSSSEDTRKQQGLSTWTASTLVAMSYDASSSSDMSVQQKNELIQVRKYVLEAVVRALKEAVASSDTASVKYSKYLALADLCHRILNARPNVGSSIPRSLGGGQTNANSNKEDTALSNAKIMLDKNFVAILTSAISDVDINYPHAKTILNSMLRPLEQLTKLAIKTDDGSDNDDEDQDKMDTAEEGMHVPSTPVAEGEEAPDLYRNSALGMFDAGSVIDDDEYNSGEYSDIFGSSADEEEDFDEQSGSDLSDMDESDQEDEEDFDSDDMDQDEMADDIDAEAQLISDEDDDGEEGGRELTWHLEDIEQEPGIVHAETVIDTGDERDEPNHIRHLSDPFEEEDEMDALSDFDDASENLDNDSDNDLADGMILDSEDLDTPFLPTDFHEELIMDGDELERPRSIIPAGFRRRFHNGRRTLLEGGRSFRNQSNAQGQEDIITHPLLSNSTGNQTSSGGGNSARSMIDEALSRRDLGGAPNLRNWQDFEDIIGGSAVRMLEDLLTHAPSATQAGPLRVDVTSGPGGVLRTFEFDRLPHLSGLGGHGAHLSSPALGGALGAAGNAGASNDQVEEGLSILHDFQPMSSGERWNQESRMMYGPNLGDKALKLVNKLLNILTPIAIEDDKKTRVEEEKKRQEQRRKEEEERRKAEEEKWRLAKEARKAEAEAAEAAAAAAAEAAANAPTANAESSTSAATAVDEAAQPQTNTTDNTNAENAATAEPSTTADTERTIVTIRGEPVDISGTGIDKEFLEALPDDLREEVLNQHLRDRPAPPQPAEDDSISPEFLSALPPDIRQEVIHQEAIERERRERQNRQQAPASTTASALGAAPASAGTTNTTAASDNMSASRRRPAPAEDDAKTPKKKAKARRQDGAAQLVEKLQLGTLVRLLFVPQTISKSILNRLLLNLCENSKTRGDLLSYLVCVLYDGNNDLASVDSSFALLSSSSGKSGKSSSSKPSRANSSTSAAAVTDNVPNFIAQRCLEALTYIVSNNEQSMTYFLTESDSLVSLKRSSSSRKGKNKEKAPVSWNKYPILVLMSLLDRPVFIDNSILMEQLMDLLSTMCRPFPILVKKYQEKVENKQKDPNLSERPMPKPPTIPDYYLKLVVHVLTNGECSSKTFQYTLNAISHLSALDGAQQTIVNELVEDAKQSSTQILKDLENLLDVLKTAMPGTEINSTILAPFAAATSYQAKLLRVLKTLDYMFSRKNITATTASAESKASNELMQAKNEKRMLQIYEDLNFLPLWQNLGECLSVIREKEELINVATVLLPLIESFMVVSKCTAEKGQNNVYEKVATPAIEQQLTLSTTSPESFFFVFTEKHKKVLNIMVRNNPTLMSGSFALLVRNPKMLEFDNKRNYFAQQLHKRTTPRENYAMLQLNVRRQYVFEDSYHQLQGRTGEEIKNGKLAVRFYDEEGVDAGGVTREWFSVLARQMFDPNYALFITSAADKLTYQPNRDSAVNPDHLSFFKFVGRVIGKAIYDGRLLDAYFTRSFYKHILGRTVDYRDVEALDPEYYKSLVWMLENDITDIIDLTFSIETDFFGTKETVDLKPNGRNIPVTEASKHEYVTLVTEQKLTTAIKDQINAFVQGFHDVIPAPLIQIFNEQELELLISGLPDIDIDDWKNNTQYEGYDASSPPVQWFWRAVRSFDQEERAKLLQFATGTSKVPLEGFSQLQGSSGVQKFQIHKDFGGENRLPSAHTCFNQIDLPQYDSYENLRANLFKAISECSTGFAFA
ncbi:ribosomal RNA biogenesis protein rrp5 [Mucor velutinosus]|uniref:HECT-type E3 ubiquitin transferase n=1 Tax=Mucor velutinosus TaxID=708070 RepID=A0AAN7DLW1_9FUNG|nr:ribosomal RNA biogenesis protein rrp5 [Mucor velutinosus]